MYRVSSTGRQVYVRLFSLVAAGRVPLERAVVVVVVAVVGDRDDERRAAAASALFTPVCGRLQRQIDRKRRRVVR